MQSADGLYTLEVLIDGQVQPVYTLNGKTYVESKLDTHVTKMVNLTEGTPWGKEEAQWPVTPYSIRVRANVKKIGHNVGVRVYVDGVRVARYALTAYGDRATIHGFDTGDVIKEFQFSFPRYARDEYDRMDSARVRKLGTISATFHPASEGQLEVTYRSREITKSYSQGNKKDAVQSGGNTFMSTTRQGDVLEQSPGERDRAQDELMERLTYKTDDSVLLSELILHYRVQRVLEQLGIVVEKRDVAAQNRRLFGETFDSAPAPAPADGATAPVAPAGPSRPLKQRKVEVDLDA